MEYDVKELSPVKRQVTVTVPAEEVNASLAATVALYKRSHDVKGFRKGKAPASVIESKFRKQIYNEAGTDLINYQINEILNSLSLLPMSRIDVDTKGEFERDQNLVYTISFEVAPEFELPPYVGLEVEQEEVRVTDEDIAAVEHRILDKIAEIKPIEDVRVPQDGEVVSISFAAYRDGEIFEGIKAESFDMVLGEGQALPEFEAFIKTLVPGQSGERDITFPEDFINPQMAGQTVTMKATLHAVKSKKLPELSDEVAKKAGFETVEKMHQGIRESYQNSRGQLARANAQKTLLDKILTGLDFPLPPSMVEDRIERLLGDLESRLDRMGKSLKSLGKSLEELREQERPKAEEAVRTQLLLLAVAKRESLEVTPEEIDQTISQAARQTRQPFEDLKRYYEENNLVMALKDRILADKAMDFIYGKARVTMTPPACAEANAAKQDEAGRAADTTGDAAR